MNECKKLMSIFNMLYLNTTCLNSELTPTTPTSPQPRPQALNGHLTLAHFLARQDLPSTHSVSVCPGLDGDPSGALGDESSPHPTPLAALLRFHLRGYLIRQKGGALRAKFLSDHLIRFAG